MKNPNEYFTFTNIEKGKRPISMMSKGGGNNGIDVPIWAYGGCPYTEICENNRCFYRQRDVFGVSPWWNGVPSALHDEQVKIIEKLGGQIFPELQIYNGTNCIQIYCKDMIHVCESLESVINRSARLKNKVEETND